jgi:SAM-dependent methyltransferase
MTGSSMELTYKGEVRDYFAGRADHYDDVVLQHYWRLSDELLWWAISSTVLPSLPPDARLLDAGGGTARWSERLLRTLPRASAVVLDLSQHMLDRAAARARQPELRGRLGVEQGDLDRLGDVVACGAFDLVFCLHNVLGFVTDPESVVRQLAQTLRPDGFLVLVVPNLFHTMYFNLAGGRVEDAAVALETGRGRFTSDMPEIHLFTPQVLRRYEQSAGLEPVLLGGFPCTVYPGREETRLHGATHWIQDLLSGTERFASILEMERSLLMDSQTAARGNNLLLISRRRGRSTRPTAEGGA